MFFLTGIILIVSLFRSNILSNTENINYSIHPSRKLKFILLLYSIISIVPFFGLIQSYIPIQPVIPFYQTFVLSFIIGGIIYLVLLQLLLVLIKFTSIKTKTKSIKISKSMKDSMFFLLILILSMTFTNQSMITVKDEAIFPMQPEHTFYSRNLNTYNQISPDLTKLASIIHRANSNEPFLLIEDIPTSITNIYSLCSTKQFCLNSSSIYNLQKSPYPYYSLKFVNDTTIYIFCYKNIDNDYYYNPITTFVFNLPKKQITAKYELNVLSPFNSLSIYSKPYVGTVLTNRTNFLGVNITDCLTQENALLNVVNTVLVSSPSYSIFSISPDFSRLALVTFVNNTNYLSIFRISANNLILLSKIELQNLPNVDNFHFIQWDSSNLFYNYGNKGYNNLTAPFTIVGQYNTSSKHLIQYYYTSYLDIQSINTQQGMFQTYYENGETRFFSLTNNTVETLQTIPVDPIFEAKGLNFIVGQDSGNSLELFTLNNATHLLKAEKTLFVYYQVADVNAMNVLVQATLVLTAFDVIFLISAILDPKIIQTIS